MIRREEEWGMAVESSTTYFESCPEARNPFGDVGCARARGYPSGGYG
jgi:hypothetical protein